jgi:4,5-DOPA dioxygenase extradiol
MFKAKSLFIGHGSPMNIVEKNNYTKSLKTFSEKLENIPKVLILSAHWLTSGQTEITYSDEILPIIYDFGGFPQELYNTTYKAKGNKNLSQKVQDVLSPNKVVFNSTKGLDHGACGVLKILFPKEKIEVAQLSLNINLTPQERFEIGQKLTKLREENVTLIFSGNVIHNFEFLDFSSTATPQKWATEFENLIIEKTLNRKFVDIIDQTKLKNGNLAAPTPEHYWPFVYFLGTISETDKTSVLYKQIQNGSISMLSFLVE